MTDIKFIDGFAELASAYTVVLCDVWGVIHNGRAAYPEACAALLNFRSQGGTVLLLSNAPRPHPDIVVMLDRLGVDRDSYDLILTSGDAARSELTLRSLEQRRRLLHLGPDRDRPVYDGLNVEIVGVEEADLVLCTGLADDEAEGPDDYREVLARAAARRLTMICANPDIQVERGPKLIWCAGALAAAYEKVGGEVVYYGKPHRPIYEGAFARIDEHWRKRVDRDRVLAIGDSLRTDIAGANGAGLPALLVTGGIHAEEFGGATPDRARVRAACKAAGVDAAAAMYRLRW